jgi:hypothetical protein
MSQISAFGVDHGVDISKRGGKIARLLGRGAKGARGAKKVVPAPRVSGPGPKGPGGPPRPGSPGYQPIGPGPTGPKGPVGPKPEAPPTSKLDPRHPEYQVGPKPPTTPKSNPYPSTTNTPPPGPKKLSTSERKQILEAERKAKRAREMREYNAQTTLAYPSSSFRST